MESDVTRQPQLAETSRSTFTVESSHAQGPAFPWAALIWSKLGLQRPGHFCSTQIVMGTIYLFQIFPWVGLGFFWICIADKFFLWPKWLAPSSVSRYWSLIKSCEGLPRWQSGKESACQCRRLDMGSIPGLRRSPEEGNGNPLQCSLPGKFHDQRSLACYSPWCHKELDMTEHARMYVCM